MALVVADRVKETTTTTGTGAITLAGAANNFVTFSSVLSNSDTTYYAIVDETNNDFEVGLRHVFFWRQLADKNNDFCLAPIPAPLLICRLEQKRCLLTTQQASRCSWMLLATLTFLAQSMSPVHPRLNCLPEQLDSAQRPRKAKLDTTPLRPGLKGITGLLGDPLGRSLLTKN